MSSSPAAAVHTVRLPIRFRDLDQLGHVNQSVYHVFLEELRAGMLLERLGSFGGAGGGPFVLARIELDHRHEVRRDHGHVDGRCWIESIGRSSILIRNELRLPDGTVAAEGQTVLVGWDPEARTKRLIGDAERTALLAEE